MSSFIFFSKGKPGTCSNLCADDSMPPEEFHIHTKKMHTTPFAFGGTRGFSIKFSHTCIGAYPLGKSETVVTITCNKRIIGSGGRHTAGGNGFLSYISMKESTDLSFHLILFFCHHFKLPDQLHEFIPV